MKEKKNLKTYFQKYFFMTIGVMLVAFSFSFFLDPYNLVIGGVGGIAIIFKPYMDTSLMILIINIVLLFLALLLLGKESCINSIYGSLMFPAFTKVFNLIYEWLKGLNGGANLVSDQNMLLVTIIGALIMGVGLGMVTITAKNNNSGKYKRITVYVAPKSTMINIKNCKYHVFKHNIGVLEDGSYKHMQNFAIQNIG